MNSQPHHASLDELAFALAEPAAPKAPWVTALCATLDVPTLTHEDVMSIATEGALGSPAQAMNSLFAALRARHADDRTTLAMLAAIQDYHLPNALDLARGI